MRVTLLFVPFGLLGCAPSMHDQAVKTAEHFAASGDMVGAAEHWTRACRLEPSDKRSCTNAKRATAEVKEDALARAKKVCGSNSLRKCVDALAGLRRLRPNDDEAERMLERGVTKYVAGCDAEDTKNLVGALRRVACFAEAESLVAMPMYTSMVAEAREDAATRFENSLGGVGAGARFGRLDTARCLAPTAERRDRAKAASGTFVASAAVGLRAQVTSPRGSADICLETARKLGPRVRCGESGASTLRLDGEVTMTELEHSESEEIRLARYVAGISREANPERAQRESDVARAQASFDAIEQDTHDRKMRCESSHSAYACNAYNAAVPVYNRRNQELNEARYALSRTPAIVEREIVREVPYTVRHHRWTADFTFRIRTAKGNGAADQGRFTIEDSEHPSVPEAKVNADRLESPTRDTFAKKLVDAIADAAREPLSADLATLAPCRGKAWNLDDAAAFECRIASELYTRSTVPSAEAWTSGVRCGR